MKREWYNLTIFRSCFALMIVGAVSLGVAGWDDLARHELTAEGPAASSDVVAQGREVVVVIRPDNASDDAVPNLSAGNNIWQAAIDQFAAHDESDVIVDSLVYVACDEAANEPIDDAAVNSATECEGFGFAEAQAETTDTDNLVFDDGAEWTCADALCQEFGFAIHELDTSETDSVLLRKPENIIITHYSGAEPAWLPPASELDGCLPLTNHASVIQSESAFMNDADLSAALAQISTATLTMQLIKRGIRRAHMLGPTPLMSGQARVAGPAFTVRFIPAREDVATRESYAAPNSLRTAIEAMPEGAVAVFGTNGEQRSGTTGDILSLAMKLRGVAAFVSDGPVRDVEGIRGVGLPVWCTGAVAPPSIGNLFYVGYGEPIGCGGVAIFPGDFIVADDDGAIVVPRALAEEIAVDGAEQERFERFVMEEVEKRGQVSGIYPPNEETLKRYEDWLKTQG